MDLFCRILGSVLVVGGSGYLAASINSTLEQRNRELRRLYSILLQLKSEIQYMCNTLPECFAHLGKGEKPPFSSWLLGLAKRLEQKEESTFETIWREQLTGLFRNSALEQGDVALLSELADKLGNSDVTAQLKAIDYTLIHIEQRRRELENELAQKKKVVTTLSLFMGMLTLIVLL
jgi:stage III sporulation protein AB